MESWCDQWKSSRNNSDLLGLFCWESHEKMHALSHLYADYGDKAMGLPSYTCVIGLFVFVVCCRKLPGPAGGRVPVSSQRHAERLCEVPGDDWNHSGHEPGLSSTLHIRMSVIFAHHQFHHVVFTLVSFLCLSCVVCRSTTTSSWWSHRSIRCWASWGKRWTNWKRACRPCWTVQPENLVITHNTYVTYVTVCHANINKAERAQACDGLFHRMTDTAIADEITFKCECVVQTSQWLHT